MLQRNRFVLTVSGVVLTVLLVSCQQSLDSSDDSSVRRPREEIKNNPRGAKVTYFARAKGRTGRFVDTYLVVVSPTWATNHTYVDEPFKAITQPCMQVSTEEHVGNLLGFMRESGFYSLRTVPAVDVSAIQRTVTSLKFIVLEEEGNTRIVTNENLSPAQRKSFADMEAAICMAFNRAPSIAVEVPKEPVLDAFREFLRAEKERAEREKKEQENKSQQK